MRSNVGLKVLPERSAEYELLADAIRRSRISDKVRVLEAGCGARWIIDPGVPMSITGVDIDAHALELRQKCTGDLDEAIVADLRTVDLPNGQFDVAYCSFVLEHIEGAEDVLDRLRDSVRSGGRIILRIPDGRSVFGFLSKHTPHRSHVWFKRYVSRQPHAGEPGYGPYPAVYDKLISPMGIREWAASRHMQIESEYATNFSHVFFRRFGSVIRVSQGIIAVASMGQLSADHNNIGYVLVKQSVK